MYLHNRNTGDDFFQLVRENRHKFSTGVVHSFTGTLEELHKIVGLDLYIGLNGCSFKTKENIAVLKEVPLERLMIETDSPYCEIRNSHEGAKYVKTKFEAKAKEKQTKGYLVKGRNEPCNIIQVLEVIAAVKGVPEEELADITYKNSLRFFNIQE
eukprot:TRINITY_DN961_c0_g1_i1.p1 TRINITY_DN961_c0_g1~~TRINITY_DN961_c0_g1_i1.p1  ORF type:complete len:155 (-),score=33.99 TRINITY_DN961_c0_g1_i1:83-547(-)